MPTQKRVIKIEVHSKKAISEIEKLNGNLKTSTSQISKLTENINGLNKSFNSLDASKSSGLSEFNEEAKSTNIILDFLTSQLIKEVATFIALEAAISKTGKQFKSVGDAASFFLSLVTDDSVKDFISTIAELIDNLLHLGGALRRNVDSFIELGKLDPLINKITSLASKFKLLANLLDNWESIAIGSAGTVGALTLLLGQHSDAVGLVASGSVKLGKSYDILRATTVASYKTLFNQTGFFGLLANMELLGGAMLFLGDSMTSLDSKFLNFSGTTLKTLGFALISISTAVGFLVIGFGKLLQSGGKVLELAATNMTKAFVKADTALKSLNATIGAMTAASSKNVGSISSWDKKISEVSETYGLLNTDLRKSVQEILVVGKSFGYNQKQMEKLLEVSAAYGTSFGKNVFDSTVSFVRALNGQSNAVVNMGIKLDEASLKAYAYKKGLDRSVASMDSAEKQGLRLNSVIDQYNKFAPVAAANANSLAAQTRRYDNAVTNLYEGFGKGSQVVHDLNIATLVLNKGMKLLGPNIAAVLGFMTATVGFAAKYIGFLLEWSLKIYAISKAWKFLTLLLSEGGVASILGKQIPLLGKSLDDLIVKMTKTQGAAASFKNNLIAFPAIFKNSTNAVYSFAKSLLVGEAATISFGTVFKVQAARVVEGLALIKKGAKKAFIWLAANPAVIIIGILAASVFALYKALEFLEKETKVFTTLWADLTKGFQDSPFKELLIDLTAFASYFTNFFKDVVGTLLGIFVLMLSKVLTVITFLASKMPFLGDQTKKAFSKASGTLSDFNKRLQDAGTNIFNMEKAQRKLASGGSYVLSAETKRLNSRMKEFKTQLGDVTGAFSKGKKSFADATLDMINLNIQFSDIGKVEGFSAALKKAYSQLDKGKRVTSESASQLQKLGLVAEKIELGKQLDKGVISLTEYNAAVRELSLTNSQFKLSPAFEALINGGTAAEFEKSSASVRESMGKQIAKNDLLTAAQDRLAGSLSKEGFEQLAQVQKDYISGVIKSYDEYLAKLKEVTDKIKEIQDSRPPGTVGAAQDERKDKVKALKKELGELSANDPLGGLINGIKTAAAETKTLTESMKDLGKSMIDGLGSAIGSIVDGTKSAKEAFKDFAKSIIKQLIDIGIQKAIVAAIKLIGFASGGVFSAGKQVTKFAQGGVVNSPTIFPMAKGMGLMGEAGPEAVIPLSRGSNGKLGVNAEGMGGGSNVEVNIINQSGGEVETNEKEGPNGIRIIEVLIKKTVKDGLGNGEFDRSFQSNFNLNRRGV